jgi:hypothetical protein
VLSNLGETDEHQLASSAALYLRAFAGAMRISSSSKRAQAKDTATNHFALEPDAISAMAEALDRCLDELPQGGVSSRAREVFQKAIVERPLMESEMPTSYRRLHYRNFEPDHSCLASTR